MTGDYHTIGAQQDRARTWALQERIAKALERIADSLEAFTIDQTGNARRGPVFVEGMNEQPGE